MEGYRQFIKNDILDANPLHPPVSNDSLDLSKVLDKPCNPYGVPDETIDDLQIFQKSHLHGFLEYHFHIPGSVGIICNINELLLFYNNTHKRRNISYDAIKYSVRILGYILAPQYGLTYQDDIIFGVDSDVFREFEEIFQICKEGKYFRLRYPKTVIEQSE